MYTPVALLTLLSTSVLAANIVIDVGDGGLNFSPNSTTAAVGDKLQFRFYIGANNPHSVVSAAFNAPCVPGPNAFFSGYLQGTSDGAEIFEVDVTSTDPIWYYCSARAHCENGMVGVINPPASGNTLESFRAAAAAVPAASAPASATGGSTVSSAPSSSQTSAQSDASSRASSASSVISSAASVASTATGSASSSAQSVASSASVAATATSTTSPNAAAATAFGSVMGMVMGGVGLVGALV